MIFNKHRLGEFVDTVSDTTKISNDKVILINTSDVLDGKVLNREYVENKNLKGQFKKRFKKNDILYSEIRPANKRFAFIDFDSSDYLASTKLMVLRNKGNINNRFLFNLLSSNEVINELQRIAVSRSGTFPQITYTELSNLEVNIPDIQSQNKIGKILDLINQKIEINNKTNNNLHDLVESIFNKYNESASDGKLDYLVDIIQTGSRPKGGAQTEGIPSIGAEKIEKFGIYDYSSEKYISEDYFEKLKNGIVKSKDVLLYKDGAYTGKVSMALNGFPHDKCAVNEHVFILRTKELYAQNYLYFTLNNKEIKEKLHMLACGKAAQPGLNQIELKSIDIKLIDKDKIIEFENKVSPIMEKIALNSLMNKNLSQLRDTLLPKVMNGEIDLDNIEI